MRRGGQRYQILSDLIHLTDENKAVFSLPKGHMAIFLDAKMFHLCKSRLFVAWHSVSFRFLDWHLGKYSFLPKDSFKNATHKSGQPINEYFTWCCTYIKSTLCTVCQMYSAHLHQTWGPGSSKCPLTITDILWQYYYWNTIATRIKFRANTALEMSLEIELIGTVFDTTLVWVCVLMLKV